MDDVAAPVGIAAASASRAPWSPDALGPRQLGHGTSPTGAARSGRAPTRFPRGPRSASLSASASASGLRRSPAPTPSDRLSTEDGSGGEHDPGRRRGASAAGQSRRARCQVGGQRPQARPSASHRRTLGDEERIARARAVSDHVAARRAPVTATANRLPIEPAELSWARSIRRSSSSAVPGLGSQAHVTSADHVIGESRQDRAMNSSRAAMGDRRRGDVDDHQQDAWGGQRFPHVGTLSNGWKRAAGRPWSATGVTSGSASTMAGRGRRRRGAPAGRSQLRAARPRVASSRTSPRARRWCPLVLPAAAPQDIAPASVMVRMRVSSRRVLRPGSPASNATPPASRGPGSGPRRAPTSSRSRRREGPRATARKLGHLSVERIQDASLPA